MPPDLGAFLLIHLIERYGSLFFYQQVAQTWTLSIPKSLSRHDALITKLGIDKPKRIEVATSARFKHRRLIWFCGLGRLTWGQFVLKSFCGNSVYASTILWLVFPPIIGHLGASSHRDQPYYPFGLRKITALQMVILDCVLAESPYGPMKTWRVTPLYGPWTRLG